MNEPAIDLTGKLIIKVALGDDIRRILITNEDITYDELVLMMQRVYRGKLNSTDDIVIKYKDEDNDLITIFDSSDLSFATQCSRILKITLFVNSKPEPLQTDEIKMIKTELKHIRDRCTKLLDRLDEREVAEFPSSTIDSTTNKFRRVGEPADSPKRQPAPSPRMQTPTNTAGSKEFDPFSRQRSTEDHQEKVLSSFGINNDDRSGTPDSISSIGSAGQRQPGQAPPQAPPQTTPQPSQAPSQSSQATPQGPPQATPPHQQSQQPQQPQQPGQQAMYPGASSAGQKLLPWQQQNQQQNASGQPFPGQQQQGYPASSQHQGLPGQPQQSPSSQGQTVPTSASTGASYGPAGTPYSGYSQPGQPAGAMTYGGQQQPGQYIGQQQVPTGAPGQPGHPSPLPQQQQQPQQQQPYYVQQQPQQPGPPGPPGPGGNNPYARQGPGYGAGYPRPATNYPQGYQ